MTPSDDCCIRTAEASLDSSRWCEPIWVYLCDLWAFDCRWNALGALAKTAMRSKWRQYLRLSAWSAVSPVWVGGLCDVFVSSCLRRIQQKSLCDLCALC